jgi:hypothetical protein
MMQEASKRRCNKIKLISLFFLIVCKIPVHRHCDVILGHVSTFVFYLYSVWLPTLDDCNFTSYKLYNIWSLETLERNTSINTLWTLTMSESRLCNGSNCQKSPNRVKKLNTTKLKTENVLVTKYDASWNWFFQSADSANDKMQLNTKYWSEK